MNDVYNFYREDTKVYAEVLVPLPDTGDETVLFVSGHLPRFICECDNEETAAIIAKRLNVFDNFFGNWSASNSHNG